MARHGAVIAAALLASIAAGCSFDNDAKPGVQGACFSPTGTPLGCDDQPIESSEDACNKLIACGVVPVENEMGFDYSDCLELIDELESFQFEFALACIEASSCEELASTSTCVEHGEEFP
jgi:hypothetical protein